MLRAHAPGRLLVSSGGHLVAMLGYFLAVAYMPLAELTALAFTKPLFATLGAALILREVVRGRRWTAIAIGFLGVMIVLRPGAEAFSPYAGLVLLSAVASAAVVLMVKQMTLRDGSTTIVLYQTLFLTILSLAAGALVLAHARPREPAAGRADRRARHDRLAVLHARLRARRRVRRDALRVPQAADHRRARLPDVRRGAERLDLARRGGDLRRQHLHRASRGQGRAHPRRGRHERRRAGRCTAACGRAPEAMQITRAGFLALPPIVQAALMMTGGAACVAFQNGMIRIVSAEIHTFEIVFFRNLFGLVALLPAMGGGGSRRAAHRAGRAAC